MGKLNSKGFGAVEILLVILILLIAGFGGYYVYHNQNSAKPAAKTSSTKNSSTPTKTPAKTDPYAGWKTYTSAYENVSFQYPKNWSISSVDAGAVGTKNTTLTSPNGYKLTYYDDDALGSGATCGNQNVSLTAAEAINVSNAPHQIYIVESGNEIALRSADVPNDTPTVGDTGGCLYGPSVPSVKYPDTASAPGKRIGFTSNKYFTVGSPTPVGTSQQADFATAKLILKSFKYN